MPLGQSTVYSYAAPQPRCATEPEYSVRSIVAVSGRRDTRREETSTRAAEVPRSTLAGAAIDCGKDVPRSAHSRESRISRRQAPGPVSRMLIQLGTPCHALVQRRHLQSHRFSAQGGEAITKPAAVCSAASGWAHRATRTLRSLHTLRRAWRTAQRSIGSRARTCLFTVASTPTHRPWPLAHPKDTRANRSPSTSCLVACHRLSAAVTLVSSDITRMSGGLMLEHGLAVPTRVNLGNRV